MSDVAFLAALDESTVCRLWEDPEWLDRIKGKSLQALISVLPGVAEYVFSYPLANRRSVLVEELDAAGLEVSSLSYRQLRDDGVPEQYICNALRAALQIVRFDTRQAAAYLVRFWGREQDYALDFLYAPVSNKGLLLDLEILLTSSIKMVDELGRHTNSFHAVVAQATLMHHITKATGNLCTDLTSSMINRRSALTYRSTMIGLMLQSNNCDVAATYHQMTERSPLLSMVEGWAFPTYSGDAKLAPDFSLPPSLLLQNTADEILWEIDHYNDAYLYYLLETGMPRVIRRDRTFGLRMQDLIAALRRRIDTCKDPSAVRTCEIFLGNIQVGSAGHGGGIF